MSGDYFVSTPDGKPAGRVMSFAGNPHSKRWVAFSVTSKDQPGFRTRRLAINWLVHAAPSKGGDDE